MKTALACIFLAGIISSAHSACSFDPTTGRVECDVYVQWTDSEGGAVSWAKDCDFKGHDVSIVNSYNHESCGKLCLSNTDCSHFTWSVAKCYMKKNFRETAEEPSKSTGDYCGFMPKRTDFTRVGK